MKITPEILAEAFNDPKVTSPEDIQSQSQNETWWDDLDIRMKKASKVIQWQMCQVAAMVLDVYSPHIQSVELSIGAYCSMDEDNAFAYASSDIRINNLLPFNLDTDIKKLMEEIDNREAVSFATKFFDHPKVGSLLPMIEEIAKNLNNRSFTCADQARALAAKIHPELNAWFTQKLLTELAQEMRGGVDALATNETSSKPKI